MKTVNLETAKIGMNVVSNKFAYNDYKKFFGVITNVSVYGLITVKCEKQTILVYAYTLNFMPVTVIR